MARQQVLVQLDDELVGQLDTLAKRLSVSRSELLRRGAEAVLRSEDWAAADRELIEAYRARPVDGLVAGAEHSRALPEW